MKFLSKIFAALLIAGVLGTCVSEYAIQLAETTKETVARHDALLGDE
jgi:hypothetical protein